MAKQFITKEGLEKLKEDLNYLKTEKRQEISRRIQAAKELGDLSENAEYSEAKEQQALNEGRVAEMEETLKNAETIDDRHSRSDIVNIGSTIKVKNGENERVLTIVGSNEANPSEGKISNETPLAMSFLGHKVNDKVEVETPKGEVAYLILNIS
ncbi:MAG: transcription elongation factor GreA [Candidatus Pacebacteria bacterium]|nr:transcription elongation factor GreA [Candidatus Paceibacterota bacterium]